ncbi:hypothetical protein CRV09_00885 [Candidatus Pantoea edessiphila]|uniref:M23ase beta-sheet core domain-containing protein n=1 Tax=Candidatus Pantoea edessiphila TaxID=2044610 RepID=A0A2P5T2N7_9GAMM|nr:hypothetical protein CRV09_00885 [Candidatus Pantoea edessiphila]
MKRKIIPSIIYKFSYLSISIYSLILLSTIIFVNIKMDYFNEHNLSQINNWINLDNNSYILLSKFYSKQKINLPINTNINFVNSNINLNKNLKKSVHLCHVALNKNINETVLVIDHHVKIKKKNYINIKNKKLDKNKNSILLKSFVSLLTKKKKLRVSSNFNLRRLNPVTGHITPHKGVDFALPIDTPIFAVDKGKVIVVKNDSIGAGNYIAILHNYGYITRYMHMNKILVKVGQKVQRGEKIGLSGNTGRSTGPHLHFEIWINNKAIDPLKVYLSIGEIKKNHIKKNIKK